MQAAGDDGALSPLLMERVQPSAALEVGNDARLGGDLGAAVSHAGVETTEIRLEGKEAARSDVNDAGALEQGWEQPHEPPVDRRRIRGRSNDATGQSTIWMREGCHIRVEIEDPQTSSGPQDSNQFRNGSLPLWNLSLIHI